MMSKSIRNPQSEIHNPLHASHYADRACQVETRVVENVRLARDTYRVRLECSKIGQRFVPGQFVMLRLPGPNDPLLGRPLAIYNVVPGEAGVPAVLDIVYLVLGKMTRRLAQCVPGDELQVWGPLGNGFPARPAEHLIMVAGGIGQTPFLTLGQEYLGRRRYGDPPRAVPTAGQVTLLYGVRSADLAAGVADFEAAGIEVRLASDDGTLGHHGLVTELLADALAEGGGEQRLVVTCGPEAMMEAVARLCAQASVPCLVSLETPMACGIGICFSCVTKVRQPRGGWDWKRTCVEGPVFDAERIVW